MVLNELPSSKVTDVRLATPLAPKAPMAITSTEAGTSKEAIPLPAKAMASIRVKQLFTSNSTSASTPILLNAAASMIRIFAGI